MDINFIDTTNQLQVAEVVVLRMKYLSFVNYSYLVVDRVTNRAVIIDPAWDIEKVYAALADTGSTLSGILVTHAHPDHIHLAQPLAAAFHCPVWMSHEEIHTSGFNIEQLNGIQMMPWSVGRMIIQPILTPGHTKGSTCYLIGNHLFSGDTLFAEGCGLCADIPAAHAMFDSLERLKKMLTPETRIYPGHMYGKPPGQPFEQLLKDNIYLQFKNPHDFAAYRLRKGQDTSGHFKFY
ncbi:MBL fold metallo-hydrolase [Chitinophaga varians]|uniref:MBL fold metallo-hydrolase n=1 Tax=Chitinophaga varians TaxID=2202339 RepID=UPI00165F8B77|nr:MBL fold metallo-hydrolase [Chitinophaga varians]MBC9915299.1 MBL fold metallo-hydrolase [Chitinophaga varians]